MSPTTSPASALDDPPDEEPLAKGAGGLTAGVSWLAAAQVGRRVLSLLATVVIARLVGPQEIGLVGLALLPLGLLSQLGDGGIGVALVQRATVDQALLATGFRLIFGFTAALALVGAGVAWPLARALHEPRLALIALSLAAMLPLNAIGAVPDVLLQRRLAFRAIALVEIAGNVAAAVVGIGLALAGAGAWAVVAQYLVTALVNGVGRLVAAPFSPWGRAPTLAVSPSEAPRLLRFGLRVMGGSIAGYGMRNVDNLLVGAVLGPRALGLYAVAYNLVMLPSQAVTSLAARVAYPALAPLQREPERLGSAWLRVVARVALVALPLCAGLGATAPLFVRAVYGARWVDAAPLLRVLVVVGATEALALSPMLFVILDRPGALSRYTAASLLVMSAVFALAVPHGLPALALAYAVIAPVVHGLPLVAAARLVGVGPRRLASKLALPASACAGLALVAIAVSRRAAGGPHPVLALALAVAAGALVYVAVLSLLARLVGGGRRSFARLLVGELP